MCIRDRRNPPAQMASTTSLTVTEKVFLMVFTPESGTEQKANPRCGVMDRLSDVRGAWKGKVIDDHSGETRMRNIRRAERLRWADVRAARTGVPANRGIERRAISHPGGARSHRTAGVSGRSK